MRFFGSAVMAIAALALLVSFAGSAGTAEAAKLTMKGVAIGAEENPPVPGGASVYVTFTFDDVTNDLTYAATVSGLSKDLVTASHIHRGAKGVNGPIVHTLSAEGFTQISGSIKLSAADVADLRAGNFYFNAHSKDNPGGFARMQLVLPAATRGPVAQQPGRGPVGPQASLQGRRGQPSGRPAPSFQVRPPRTGDAGLAVSSSLLPIVGIIVFATSGAGVLAIARKRS